MNQTIRMRRKAQNNFKNRVDIDDISTWSRYKKRLCSACRANCCTMPVEVTVADLIRMEVISAFDAGEPLKTLAKRLKKDGVIEHFSGKKQLFTIVRFANNDCFFLESETRKCRIYEKRPDTCRNHPRIGPRPGYCPYEPK